MTVLSGHGLQWWARANIRKMLNDHCEELKLRIINLDAVLAQLLIQNWFEETKLESEEPKKWYV